MNENSETPAEPSATWFRWNAGQIRANLSRFRQRDEEAGELHHRQEDEVEKAGADVPDAYQRRGDRSRKRDHAEDLTTAMIRADRRTA